MMGLYWLNYPNRLEPAMTNTRNTASKTAAVAKGLELLKAEAAKYGAKI